MQTSAKKNVNMRRRKDFEYTKVLGKCRKGEKVDDTGGRRFIEGPQNKTKYNKILRLSTRKFPGRRLAEPPLRGWYSGPKEMPC